MSKVIGTLSRKGYRVKKTDIKLEMLEKIKSELTVAPKDANSSENTSYKLYLEDNKHIYMPRFYAQKHFGSHKKTIGIKSQKIDIEFEGQLRDKQQVIADTCLKKIKKEGGGLLSIPCGGGKTVLGLYMACKLGYKTLILVHKTFLQDQWIERIRQFIPNASVGSIRQNKIDVEGKDIIIGMIQSVSMKDYDPSVFEGINFLVIDECHHIIARVFCRALQKISTKYVLALSATPNRKDGLTYALHWFVGNTIYKGLQVANTKVCVRTFLYHSTNPLFREKKNWINGKTRPHTVIMTTNLTKINSRNIFIANVIDKLRQQPNRKILVLSHRIEHLTRLKTVMDHIINLNEESGTLEKGECVTGFYIGKMKGTELKQTEAADIIYGSFAMAEEGLDIQELNTVVLATPKKEIEQTIGRILRKRAADMLVPPLIIDIRDDLSTFATWGVKRHRYYKGLKYNININYVKDHKLICEKEHLSRKYKNSTSMFEDSDTEIPDLYKILIINADILDNIGDDSDDDIMKPNFSGYCFRRK